MQVAIVGSGNVGQALAQALHRAGHRIIFGMRNPEAGKADQKSIAEAAEQADAADHPRRPVCRRLGGDRGGVGLAPARS